MTNIRSYFFYDDFGEIIQISETLDVNKELGNSKAKYFLEVPVDLQNVDISAVKKLYVDLSFNILSN